MASNALHHQVMSSHSTLEDIMACPKQQQQQQQQQHQEQPQQQSQQQQQEKRLRPHPEQALRCPRCDSSNTKFCYYNNYSLSQPRYFCKGCRRYWTQGGTLRNVPVGGGCRKNKRSSSTTTTSFKRFQDHNFTTTPPATNTDASNADTFLSTLPNPSLPFDPTDLALAFTRLQRQPIPTDQQHDPFLLGSSTTTSMLPNSQGPSFLDILRSGFLENGYQSVGYEFGGGAAAGGGVAVKEESVEGDNRVGGLLLQQWQEGGEGNMFLDISAGRGECCVGGIGAATAATSPWHGLVNSSLM